MQILEKLGKVILGTYQFAFSLLVEISQSVHTLSLRHYYFLSSICAKQNCSSKVQS